VVGWNGGTTWPISVFLVLLGSITTFAVISSRETSGKGIDT